MDQDPQHVPPIFHIDVSAENASSEQKPDDSRNGQVLVSALQTLCQQQQEQNELLKKLLEQMGAQQKQRHGELGQWKQAHPELARDCRQAAETLSRAQTEFLQQLTEEVSDSDSGLTDSAFLLGEFVDRYGPRLAHLNGVLQILAQLSSGDSSE